MTDEKMKPINIDLGELRLIVSYSVTANIFHIVDQISEWSPFCHKQYFTYFQDTGGFTQQDLELLKQHRELREKRGWGGGLEQTFYTNMNLDRALEEGIKSGYISEREAVIEKGVLTNFIQRITTIMNNEESYIRAFKERLVNEKDKLNDFSKRVSRFCMNISLEVPVFLIVNPDDRIFGGGFNGGRLALEIPREADPYPMFLHELMHAFLEPLKDILKKFIEDEKTLDLETLCEGISYALSPGIYHGESPNSDPLNDQVLNDIKNRRSLDNPYVRFRRFGLALRPLLTDALQDEEQTIQTFLSSAVHVWLTDIYYLL